MKRLLVSVRNTAEAQTALDCGVDLIDVKEPDRGALGAADPQVWSEVLSLVAGRAPVSCALGELVSLNATAAAAVPLGVRYVKLGLAGALRFSDWSERWRQALAERPPGCGIVAVAYADWSTAGSPEPMDVLHAGKALGCSAVLIDTFDKAHGDVFRHWPAASLERFLDEVSAAGLITVLGGGLSWESLPRAIELPIDYIAVRGLACRGGRSGAIDSAACRRLAERIHGDAASIAR